MFVSGTCNSAVNVQVSLKINEIPFRMVLAQRICETFVVAFRCNMTL